MSIQTTATRTTTLPRVNLLPPEIEERKRLQQVQAAVVLGVVAAVGGMGYLYYQGAHNVDAAKHQLAAATAENARLTKVVASYSDVKATAAELAANEATLTQATSTEIRWSEYLADFGFLPVNTWMTSLTLTNSLPAGTLTSPDQAPAKVGQISVKGDALKYGDLATWLDKLADERDAKQQQVLSNVYFSKADETYIGPTKVVEFAGTADLPAAGLSGRCATPGSC